jgi:hypothetical protein
VEVVAMQEKMERNVAAADITKKQIFAQKY